MKHHLPVVRMGLDRMAASLKLLKQRGPIVLGQKAPPGAIQGPRYGGICLQVDLYSRVLENWGDQHAFLAKSAFRDYDEEIWKSWSKWSGDISYPIPVPEDQRLACSSEDIVRQRIAREPRFLSRLFYEHFDRRPEGWQKDHWYGALRHELLDHTIEYLKYLGVE